MRGFSIKYFRPSESYSFILGMFYNVIIESLISDTLYLILQSQLKILKIAYSRSSIFSTVGLCCGYLFNMYFIVSYKNILLSNF